MTSVALLARLRAGRFGCASAAALGVATAGFVGAASGRYLEISWSALLLSTVTLPAAKPPRTDRSCLNSFQVGVDWARDDLWSR